MEYPLGSTESLCPNLFPISVRIGSFRYSSRSIRGDRLKRRKPFAEKVLTHMERYQIASVKMTRKPAVNRRVAALLAGKYGLCEQAITDHSKQTPWDSEEATVQPVRRYTGLPDRRI
jgi:hypothetical protein